MRREAFETAPRRASHGFSTGTLARYGSQIAVLALVIVVLTGGRIKEALPLLGDAGIEATGDHTDKGTAIALRKGLKNDVSNVRDGESGEDRAETSDISEGVLSGSNVREGSNVSPNTTNQADIDITDNTDIRNGSSWPNDPMRAYRQEGLT